MKKTRFEVKMFDMDELKHRLRAVFGRLLGWYTIYTFSGSLAS